MQTMLSGQKQVIQSITFSKDIWTREDAVDWCRRHDCKSTDIVELYDVYTFIQHDKRILRVMGYYTMEYVPKYARNVDEKKQVKLISFTIYKKVHL